MHRRPALAASIKYWIRPDIENRIKEGAIAARFSSRLTSIGERSVLVAGGFGGETEIPADAVLLMTGYHPDTWLLTCAGAAIDPDTLKPRLDPATFETDVPGLFVAGSAVSGRETGRIFIENGRFHGEAIVKRITSSASS